MRPAKTLVRTISAAVISYMVVFLYQLGDVGSELFSVSFYTTFSSKRPIGLLMSKIVFWINSCAERRHS
jgi:hypothetical protein